MLYNNVDLGRKITGRLSDDHQVSLSFQRISVLLVVGLFFGSILALLMMLDANKK